MSNQTRNGEQVGDLIHWIDYTANYFEKPEDYVGILLEYSPLKDMFIVFCEGQICEWLAWQCEVVS